jgi:ABC-type arginine transport system permease subunit
VEPATLHVVGVQDPHPHPQENEIMSSEVSGRRQFIGTVLGLAVALGGCDDLTSSDESSHAQVLVINNTPQVLTTVTLFFGSQSISTQNVAVGGRANFTGIPPGPVSITAFGASGGSFSKSGTTTSGATLTFTLP